jgi:hypothetical protein
MIWSNHVAFRRVVQMGHYKNSRNLRSKNDDLFSDDVTTKNIRDATKRGDREFDEPLVGPLTKDEQTAAKAAGHKLVMKPKSGDIVPTDLLNDILSGKGCRKPSGKQPTINKRKSS